jgi:membrane fusion protein (multidrug efflux system)
MTRSQTRLCTVRSAALVVAVAASLAACKGRRPEASEPKAAIAPVSVQTVKIAEGDVPKLLRLSGTLRGFRETDLAANAVGRVVATSFERGAKVAEGQVLAQLDVRAATLTAAEARAQAENVRAQEAYARGECDRFAQLKAKGAITDLEFERVANQCRTAPLSVEAASARANLAAQNVGDGAIRAPFAGVVSERYVEVGQFLRQDSRVATLVNVDRLRLEIAVPEAEIGSVREGAEVRFRVAAYPERTFSGKVRFVSGAVRASTRDLMTEALVENADRALLPGMFADVELVVGAQRLPLLPPAALTSRGGKPRAFVVVGGRLEERILSVGPTQGELTGVLKGVTVGESVVTGDLTALLNGQPVL